tara:strand:+ start:34 stop:420 length:387 start_codon:yes stop_codon:yes gene_type:complete
VPANKAPRKATLDKAFSQLVKARDNYTCQVCGLRGEVECSHHIGRRKMVVRWDEDNASAKCRECHAKMDGHPLDHADWVRERLGDEKYDDLKVKARGLYKMTGKDKWEHLKELNDKRKEYESDLQNPD